jgi:predicted RNA-binding Zn ribbon-like protein
MAAEQFDIPTRQLLIPRPNLSIDYVNTLEWRGSNANETLRRLPDLISWLIGSGALADQAGAALNGWFEQHPRRAATVFLEAIENREALYRLLRAKACGSTISSEDLAQLNRALGQTALRSQLDSAGSDFGWRVELKPTAPSILTAVLWSAADLLTNPVPTRLRECANERCLWLFLDDSKGGTRRWCSMQSCGNRAKAHRHYLKQKNQ